MMRLTAGTLVLDRYSIVAPPAPGDTPASVVVALDQRLGCRVDLVLAPQPVETPLGHFFLHRANVVAVLQHPALPPVLDMGFQDRHAVLVYHQAGGRLLADIMACEAGGWTGRQVLHLIVELATALGLAHARGLCHGAFSAQSVLVERDGVVAIRDLAWPPPVSALDRGDVAPEVWWGHEPTPRADVFALGQLLRRLTPPRDPRAPRELDSAVDDVVRRATAREQRERYADGAVLAAAIGALLAMTPSLEDLPVAPRPRATPYHPRPAAVPLAQHPPVLGPRPPVHVRGGLLPLTLGLGIALLPVVGAMAHHGMGFIPSVGSWLHHDDDGWRGGGGRAWEQSRVWPRWERQDP